MLPIKSWKIFLGSKWQKHLNFIDLISQFILLYENNCGKNKNTAMIMNSVTQTIQSILWGITLPTKSQKFLKRESMRQNRLNSTDFVGILTHSYETICGKNKNTVTFMNSLTQTINSIYYLTPKTEIKRSSITSPTFIMLQRPYETIIFFQASNKPGVRGSWNID